VNVLLDGAADAGQRHNRSSSEPKTGVAGCHATEDNLSSAAAAARHNGAMIKPMSG
jgi:hypothetical protein